MEMRKVAKEQKIWDEEKEAAKLEAESDNCREMSRDDRDTNGVLAMT